jgi:hypothetical protein
MCRELTPTANNLIKLKKNKEVSAESFEIIEKFHAWHF